MTSVPPHRLFGRGLVQSVKSTTAIPTCRRMHLFVSSRRRVTGTPTLHEFVSRDYREASTEKTRVELDPEQSQAPKTARGLREGPACPALDFPVESWALCTTSGSVAASPAMSQKVFET